MTEDCIIPLTIKHPEWIRPDGQLSGGNRKHLARFNYKGKTWKIHSDSHISELMKAYKEIESGIDPFVTGKTSKSGNICLELNPEIASRPKHLYIYLSK